MTQVLTPKASTATVLYLFPWLQELLLDVITEFTLTVNTGTVTLTEEQNLGQAVACLIAGGTDGVTQEITLDITTLAGQKLSRDITLLIDDGANAIIPSTTTKRQIVEMAFEEMGLSDYEFNVTPEEYQTALRRLDAMIAEWQGPGVGWYLGYNMPVIVGGSDLDDESYLPNFAVLGTAVSLALRLDPTIGKTMSPEGRISYNQSMNAIRAAFTIIPERALPSSTIRGAGAKPWGTWNPFNGAGNNGGGNG